MQGGSSIFHSPRGPGASPPSSPGFIHQWKGQILECMAGCSRTVCWKITPELAQNRDKASCRLGQNHRENPVLNLSKQLGSYEAPLPEEEKGTMLTKQRYQMGTLQGCPLQQQVQGPGREAAPHS